MFNKKILSGIVLFLIIVLFGFIRINIVNTKALSPTGEGENNYKIISNEFGDDFNEFIKDGAEIKIYTPTEEDAKFTVKILDKEIYVNNDNVFLIKLQEGAYTVYHKISAFADNIIDRFKINDKNKPKENNKSNKEDELDGIIDDFIKEME